MTVPQPPVIIVAGLPRSGTSLLMQMLEAGGVPVLTDRVREADRDNPRGYYELEAVKRTRDDPSWLDSAPGKAVKMVYRLLYDLPDDHEYRVILTRRRVEEVLASQQRMLERQGGATRDLDDRQMAELFEAELGKLRTWLGSRPNFEVLEVRFNDLMEDPMPQVRAIAEFLGGSVDRQAMAATVDPTLYRNRREG